MRISTPFGLAVGCLALISGGAPLAVRAADASSVNAAVPAFHPREASISFAGQTIAIGQSSPSLDIDVELSGGLRARDVEVAAHGDFIVTSSGCAAPTTAAGDAACTVSVAFRPTQTGLRVGDLTLRATGVSVQSVRLDAGTPIVIPTVPLHASAFAWVVLPSGTSAVTASVSGPFSVALQSSYSADSLRDVTFGATASTNGECSVPDGSPCHIYLGVKILKAAPKGRSEGSITLSNGDTYAVLGSTLFSGLSFTPVAVNAGSIPISSSTDPTLLTITNNEAGSLSLSKPTVSGPFTLVNSCGTTLAANASCGVHITFTPTATGAAHGQFSISTANGVISVPLSGVGLPNPIDVAVNPATLNFLLEASGNSAIRTVHLTNLSTRNTVNIGTLGGSFLCINAADGVYCTLVRSDTCGTLSPGSTCELRLQWLGSPTQGGSLAETVTVPITSPSSSGKQTVTIAVSQTPFEASPDSVVSISPKNIEFQTTSFGRASTADFVAVKNNSTKTVRVATTSTPDFVIDPTCGPLLPGRGCNLAVHFVPLSGASPASGQLAINVYDLAVNESAGTAPVPLATQILNVSGAAYLDAALASPSFPPLLQPLPDGSTFVVKNTSSVPLRLGNLFGASDVYVVSACPDTLDPGSTCDVLPIAQQPCSQASPCAFTIQSNAQSSPDVYSFVSTSGENDQTTFGLGPDVVVFPTTVMGTTSATALTANANAQDQSVAVPLRFTNHVSASFPVKNKCPSVLSGTPGYHGYTSVSCSVDLTFAPQFVGFHTSYITYASDHSQGTVLLAGNAVLPPTLELSATNLLLSAVAGTTDKTTLTLTNTSSASIILDSPALAGPNAADFTVTDSTCGASLAPGARCRLQINYIAPKYVSTAYLLLTSNADDVQTVNLTGVIPETLTSSSIGAVNAPVGGERDFVYTLSSFMGAPITIKSVVISGADASVFSIKGSTCAVGYTIKGVATCEITVAFKPTTTGTFTATLTVADTADKTSIGLQGQSP